MVTATHPQADFGIETACAFCSGRIGPTAEATGLGDLQFHSTCAPFCDECGTGLVATLEVDWSIQMTIVPSVYGYECVPIHHLCPDCRDTMLRAEPGAQD